MTNKEHIYDRTLRIADLVIDGNTLREIAGQLGISKSTVHYDIKHRLLEIDDYKYYQVMKQLNYHKAIRHIRGGEATKKSFEERKREKENMKSKKVIS